MTKIDQIFFEYVEIMFLLIGIANEQNPRIMTSSNYGLKIAKKNCRRKLKLVSNDAECQADSENI